MTGRTSRRAMRKSRINKKKENLSLPQSRSRKSFTSLTLLSGRDLNSSPLHLPPPPTQSPPHPPLGNAHPLGFLPPSFLPPQPPPRMQTPQRNSLRRGRLEILLRGQLSQLGRQSRRNHEILSPGRRSGERLEEGSHHEGEVLVVSRTSTISPGSVPRWE